MHDDSTDRLVKSCGGNFRAQAPTRVGTVIICATNSCANCALGIINVRPEHAAAA